ncbi:hypothetical protein PMAYCL1PPCAC_23242, partial [Pristionchus mayeri]
GRMPRGRSFKRPHWMRERSPSPSSGEDEEEAPPDLNWGLPDWLENWLHSRRSLGPLSFAFGVFCYCIGLWLPIEDWILHSILPHIGEVKRMRLEKLKCVVGPTVVMLLSLFLVRSHRHPDESFHTAHVNGVNAAGGAFVGHHLMTAAPASSNYMVAALTIAPGILSFLSAFFDYDHAYVNPLVMTAILGGACLPAWSALFALGGLPLEGLALIDICLFTMAAAMTECYARKVVDRLWRPGNFLTPLATQMGTDLVFCWLAGSYMAELAASRGVGVVPTVANVGEMSAHSETASQILRFVNIIAILVLLGQTIVWAQEMWHSGARGYAMAAFVCIFLQVVYVNELGPMPLIYQETHVSLPPRIGT